MKKPLIKYYRVICDYKYAKFYISILEYYLIKEGYILCSDYKENPNDSYYNGIGGEYTIEDFVIKRNKAIMFKSLEKAKEVLKQELDSLYIKESLYLSDAYDLALEQLRRNYKGIK
jgi:hypothetical protein